MYILVNMIRMNPHEYALRMNIQYICPYRTLEPLRFDSQLQRQVEDRIPQLNDPDCYESDPHFYHDTCPKYCYSYYRSCSYIDRVQYYCPECVNIEDNLIAHVKSPLKALHMFLEKSAGHCENIMSTYINSIGTGGNGKPWYIQTFAFKQSNLVNMDDICSYLWKSDNTSLSILCVGQSVFPVQIQWTNQTIENITMIPFLTYYSYYGQINVDEHSVPFRLYYQNQTLESIDERFYMDDDNE